MAKSPKSAPQRLKVYQAVFGFHESVVAAPNQAAALKAWGTRQNLFAEGTAKVASDEKAAEAAIAHPLTPLRRAIGSTAAFSLESSAPSFDAAQIKPATSGKVAASKPPRPWRPEPPPPDRSALTAAEAALERLEQARKQQEKAFRRRREALDAEAAAARAQWTRDRTAARKALQREREAYRKAVGKT